MNTDDCELCHAAGGELLWADDRCRVVRIGGEEGARFPGFCRVIWQAHVVEMGDLDADDARHLLDVVMAVERTIRQQMSPDKINLASLGNLTPHLHWHVIPRWHDDSHFPLPIWAAPQRTGRVREAPATDIFAAALRSQLLSSLRP